MKWLKLFFCVLCMCFGHNALMAQEMPSGNLQQTFRLSIKKANSSIVVDGNLDETAWQTAQLAKDFFKKFPVDVGAVALPTTVKVTYDDKFLYIGAVSYDSTPAFIQTLRRDAGHDGSDGFGIILDPLNQHTTGFFFVVNAFNAQSEDQLNNGDEGVDFSWDNKWFSQTKRFATHWVAEIAIPFKTLRYQPTQSDWGINFLRVDTKHNEYSAWTKIPINFRSYNLGYTGALVWDAPPPPAGSNMVFLPYVTGGLQSTQTEGKHSITNQQQVGFDAKIGLNSSLNLDLTVHSDFSQIEVDRQITNLTRFNLFFPERRTFFLENSDLFANFGYEGVRPFYSRRIGLDGSGNKIPIIAGARLTGNIGARTRIGVLNMQTGNKGSYGSENYTAATLQTRVLERSSVKAYFLNRVNTGENDQNQKNPLGAFGRNVGTEFNYISLNGKWEGWGSYHSSFKPGISSDHSFGSMGAAYSGRHLNVIVDVTHLGTNYYADMGFVQRIENYDAVRDTIIRLGYNHLYTEVEYRIFRPEKKLNSHSWNASSYAVYNPNGSLNEHILEMEYNMQFSNTATFNWSMAYNHTNLLYPISFTDGVPIPAGTYNYTAANVAFNSDYRKPFQWSLAAGYGEFYSGKSSNINAGINFRKQPHFNIGINAQINRLVFPGSYGSANLVLISPRIDINFSTSVFWTTFLQWNTQSNNFNVNSRLQWRYRPMSDLFVVYTDNYFTDPMLKNKNRALVFKMNYWLNL